MPAYDYSFAHNAFVKRCTDCGTVYVGTESEAESQAILHRYFHHNSTLSDGFQSYCRKCQHARIRRSNGVVGEVDIETLHKSQNGTCAICQEPIELFQGRGKGSHLDHDHETGAIRGLLCPNCNQGLGKFKDSEVILQRAIDYLKKHREGVS